MRLLQHLTEEWYKPKGNSSVKNIAERYYDEGDKAHDSGKTYAGNSYTIIATVKELDKYKEYDWNKKNFRQIDWKPEYWVKLKKDIKKKGVREPLIITLYKNERRAKISEGNHRLGIAKELGLKDLPVRFLYYMGDKPKPPEKPDKEFDALIAKVAKEKEDKEIDKLMKSLGLTI